MKEYKDFFGKTLKIGDKVAYISTNYQSFHVGYISKFTPMKVSITDIHGVHQTTREPNRLVKE